MNFNAQVLAFVLEAEGEVTTSKALGALGRFISAARAATAGRRCRRHSSKGSGGKVALVDLGRRHLITSALCNLTNDGRLRRVRRGVYAPPPPRLLVTA